MLHQEPGLPVSLLLGGRSFGSPPRPPPFRKPRLQTLPKKATSERRCATPKPAIYDRQHAPGPMLDNRKAEFKLGVHHRGVQWEGGAVDGGSII